MQKLAIRFRFLDNPRRFFGSLWYVRRLLLSILAAALTHGSANATILRIVSYNTECAGQGSDNNITGSGHTLPTVIEGIGLHHLGDHAQPVDVLGLEELLSTTLANLTTQLNAFYGAGTYGYDTTPDPNTGGGQDGLIYNKNTVQIISARALLTGQTVLLQSNGTYTKASSPGGGTNGVTRAPMVYQLRPVGYGQANDLYMYVSHARSTTDDTVGDARYAEAQEVRSDAKYKLPAGAHILYSGDWNLFKGSEENAYKCLTGQQTSDAIDWSDTSAIWANQNPTQAYDPVSKTVPPTVASWANASTDGSTYLYGDSTTALTSRIDVHFVNGPMLRGYNQLGGIQLAPDPTDPYDTLNFPASQYPYAFEIFGNNGSTSRSAAANSSTNHSLNDLANTVPNAATVYADLHETGSGKTFTGSDHYPVVGDYIVVPSPPKLTELGLDASGYSQLQVVSTENTTFEIQASSDLGTWQKLGSGTTDSNGLLNFTDQNSASFPARFYRAYWSWP